MTLLLAIFVVLFVSIGSACAADIVSDVNSDINLNSEEIIANSNGIDNCNEVISSQSAISVDAAKTNASDLEISSDSASNVGSVSTNDVNNNVVITSVGASKKVSIKQVIEASKNLKSYVDTNHKLPSTVKVGSYTVTPAQLSYLESISIIYIYKGKSTSTTMTVIDVNSPSSASYTTKLTVSKKLYVSRAGTLYRYVASKKVAPKYLTFSSKAVDFRVYTYNFAKILAWYDSNGKVLPSSCAFDSSVFNVPPTPKNTSTIAQVITAAMNLKSYVESNHKLPSTVAVGSYTVTPAQLTYLESIAIQYLNAGKSTSISMTVINVSTPASASYTTNVVASKSSYVSAAKTVYKYVASNKVAPKSITISSKTTDFRVYTYGFAKILAWYNNNGKVLPSSCTFDSSVFNSGPTPVPSENYTISQILAASVSVKNYVETNKALPNNVNIGSGTVSIAKYCYLASMAIQNIKNGKSASTIIKALNASGNSATYSMDENVYTNNYVSAAKAVSGNISSKGVAPAYVGVPSSKADFRVYTYGFAKILNYYKTYNALPNYCRFNSTAFSNPTPSGSYTISQILAASVSVKNYVEANMTLPSTVTVGSGTVSIAQYSYLASMAIQNIKAGKSTSTTIKVLNASGNSATYSMDENVYTNDYVSAAKAVSGNISSKGVAPAYVGVPSSKADFRVYTYGFAKILNYYKTNGALPNYCRFNSTAFVLTPTNSTTFTFNQILDAADYVKSYVDSYHSLPTYVEVGSYRLTAAQFAYLEAALIKNLNEGKTSGSLKFVNIATPSNINSSVNINPDRATYAAAANNVYTWANEHGADPSYVTINKVNVPFNLYTYAFAKILVWYTDNKNTLPATCSFNSSVFESAPSKIPSDLKYSKGINERAGSIDMETYLKISGHCASNSAIKQLAQDLTKNCKNDWEKATALFNYVRDKVSYSSYYNSVYDATGTLSRKAGNCCDQSNLLVALCREAGLACRYCHGNPCYFRSGLTVGHVWVQIYIQSTDGPVWVAADPVSTSNSLGYIVNWNSMGTLNQYAQLPF